MFLSIQERVERGMNFLDQTHPGWRSQINSERLDIMGEQSCIMGQLRESFSKGRDELGLSNSEAASLGFYAEASGGSPMFREYDDLTREWLSRLAV